MLPRGASNPGKRDRMELGRTHVFHRDAVPAGLGLQIPLPSTVPGVCRRSWAVGSGAQEKNRFVSLLTRFPVKLKETHLIVSLATEGDETNSAAVTEVSRSRVTSGLRFPDCCCLGLAGERRPRGDARAARLGPRLPRHPATPPWCNNLGSSSSGNGA